MVYGAIMAISSSFGGDALPPMPTLPVITRGDVIASLEALFWKKAPPAAEPGSGDVWYSPDNERYARFEPEVGGAEDSPGEVSYMDVDRPEDGERAVTYADFLLVVSGRKKIEDVRGGRRLPAHVEDKLTGGGVLALAPGPGHVLAPRALPVGSHFLAGRGESPRKKRK